MSKKIAIIDDDNSILEAVQLIFQMEGYEVYTSMKGQKAIDELINFSPHVILIDVLLSGEDGRDVVRLLKTNSVLKQTPVIMFSANPNIRESTLEAGAENFIAKPFDINELIGLTGKYIPT